MINPAAAPAPSSPPAPQPRGSLRVEMVSTTDALLRLEPLWGSLLEEGGSGTVFQTHDWAAAWLRHLGGHVALRVAVARRGERTVALAPWALGRRGPFRVLGFLGGKTADYQDVIVVPGDDREELLAELLAAAAKPGGWDYLEWSGLRQDSPSRPALEGVLARLRGGAPPSPVNVFSTIPLSGSWEAYQAGLGRNLRKNARRRVRQLAEEVGPPRHAVAGTREDVDLYLDALVRQHIARWRDASGYSLFENPAAEAFYREVARRFFARGRLRLSALLAGEAVAAVDLGFEHDHAHVSCLATFDPAFARYSPGRMLLLDLVESASREGLREIDLLKGEEPYKTEFNPEIRPLYAAGLAGPGPRGYAAAAWLRSARPGLVRVLGSRPRLGRLARAALGSEPPRAG